MDPQEPGAGLVVESASLVAGRHRGEEQRAGRQVVVDAKLPAGVVVLDGDRVGGRSGEHRHGQQQPAA